MGFASKRIVVLGGTSGIGFAVATAAAHAGATVVVASSRKQRVDEALSLLPVGCEGHVLDLTDSDAIEHFFSRVGSYDHLVYTAGEPLLLRNLDALDLAEARRFFETRYWGAFAAAKFGVRGIRPGGSIVFSSGTASQRPISGWSIVASALSAMEGLARALAVELAPIRVNVVTPGLVKTELWRSMDKSQRDKLYQDTANNLLVRHVGEAHEIAQAYLYCMSQTYLTGQTMVTDGGATLM